MTVTAALAGMDEITSHVAGASRSVQAFSRSRSFEYLRSAIREMAAAGNLRALTPATFVVRRRTLVRGWAEVLKAIEQSYDRTYDPNDPNNRPRLGLPDPRYARDAQARAAAEAAIAANQQKVTRAAYYHDLAIMDMLAEATMKAELAQFRRVEPDGTDADFPALDEILRRAGLSSARRAKIDAMFDAHPGP
ncbi:MAG TPA: hypothetical protein VGC96_08875 [Candidatus Elarobacter sp.]